MMQTDTGRSTSVFPDYPVTETANLHLCKVTLCRR